MPTWEELQVRKDVGINDLRIVLRWRNVLGRVATGVTKILLSRNASTLSSHGVTT